MIAAGPARRFQVGDPDIRLWMRLPARHWYGWLPPRHWPAKARSFWRAARWPLSHDVIELVERRIDPTRDLSCGVVRSLRIPGGSERRPPPTDLDSLTPEHVRPWLHAPVYTRLQSGLGDFLAELRPTVALFVRFSGIDYDGDDDAGAKLDHYIRWVQQVAARYEGTLIDLNIGDKGSYLYINFGALLAHEDSSARALAAALELRRGSE